MNCPICGKATVENMRPFCSKRCADIDLARWMNGSYAVPSDDPEDAAELEDELRSEANKSPDASPH